MGVICEYEIELLDIFCQAMEKRDICIQRMHYTELFWSYIKVQKRNFSVHIKWFPNTNF